MTTKLDSLSLADDLWHLQRVPLLAGLSPEELTAVMKVTQNRVCGKDDVIYRPGQIADFLYILKRGSVRQLKAANLGKEKIFDILCSGDVFGEAVFFSESYRTQAVAHDESWLGVIAKRDLKALTRSYPRIVSNMLRFLYKRLEEQQTELLELSFLSVEKRLTHALLRLAGQHGRTTRQQPGMTKLRIKISHEQLAQLVAANRPHVSLIMSHFRSSGLIEYSLGRLLLNTSALAQRLQFEEESRDRCAISA